MSNKLINETSPYLLQHAENPVNWYPWCEDAFEEARRTDKPIFLSIGYSTCHWCHVMAHESFEDSEVADILNKSFISVKVDKEERPDIDGVYMSVCQAFTGSGGWPTTIFMTGDKKPFYAGTYFPKTSKYGSMGLIELLTLVNEKWKKERESLLGSADEVIKLLRSQDMQKTSKGALTERAIEELSKSFDERYGGFGTAPKFPSPHNIMFLLNYFQKSGDKKAAEMSELTLKQMYRGGIFDHIGYGFSRYSTDKYFLAPHFEKMLYDNAWLIMAYSHAFVWFNDPFYLSVAEKTAKYILGEMTSLEGGFFSAQDADSDGEEGKYYLLKPEEAVSVLGEEKGNRFNKYYDITEKGNFEGSNIPNLLKNKELYDLEDLLPDIYDYRKSRNKLHMDDKILTSWNGMMISAMCVLYRVSGKKEYLEAAIKADDFIRANLIKDNSLCVSYRDGVSGKPGFLAEYAYYIFALSELYYATFDSRYLEDAKTYCSKSLNEFWDHEKGGFYLYGKANEQLILTPKETYDGAVPSGNSIMAYNLVRLFYTVGEKEYKMLCEKQLDFMSGEADGYPSGFTMFLSALSDYEHVQKKIVIVLKDKKDLKGLELKIPVGSYIQILNTPTDEYILLDGRTTFYICNGTSCKPPSNDIQSLY